MTVDITKIQPGDEITIRCRAYERRADGWVVRALSDAKDTYIKPEYIIGHAPKPLAVGDRVRSNQYGAVVLTILAIDEEWAWLRDSGCWRVQCPLSGLTPAEAAA